MTHQVEIDSRLREIIYDAYHHKCQYCTDGEEISLDDAQIDHIIPKAISDSDLETAITLMDWTKSKTADKFDTDELNNVLNYTLACAFHNSKKSNDLVAPGALGYLLLRAKKKAPEILKVYNKKPKLKRKKRTAQKRGPSAATVSKRKFQAREKLIVQSILDYVNKGKENKTELFRSRWKKSQFNGITRNVVELPSINGRFYSLLFNASADYGKEKVNLKFNPSEVVDFTEDHIINFSQSIPFLIFNAYGSSLCCPANDAQSITLEEFCLENGYYPSRVRAPTAEEITEYSKKHDLSNTEIFLDGLSSYVQHTVKEQFPNHQSMAQYTTTSDDIRRVELKVFKGTDEEFFTGHGGFHQIDIDYIALPTSILEGINLEL
ncbi:HNH endonuclease [archaeon]|jgi:hypothetical protein|nr:HNH endonuclease [archaeon]MBT6762619.1 HNH endonuclease [archaeon]